MAPRILETAPAYAFRQAGLLGLSIALGLAAFDPAFGKDREVTLPSASDALAYCQSGKMASKDVAYISGSSGTAQFGPGYNCVQQVASKANARVVANALVAGTSITECKLANGLAAVKLCNAGDLGTYDIDYIFGKPGHTANGPGYGCTINYSTAAGGGAICK